MDIKVLENWDFFANSFVFGKNKNIGNIWDIIQFSIKGDLKHKINFCIRSHYMLCFMRGVEGHGISLGHLLKNLCLMINIYINTLQGSFSTRKFFLPCPRRIFLQNIRRVERIFLVWGTRCWGKFLISRKSSCENSRFFFTKTWQRGRYFTLLSWRTLSNLTFRS